jgi:hypothetical protein
MPLTALARQAREIADWADLVQSDLDCNNPCISML